MPSTFPTSTSSSQQSNPIAHQPAAKNPPKSPEAVLAEAEAQWIFTETELLLAPSILDGMPVETERELRTKGVNFILQVGIMLKLPQLTLSTAAVFFNRFLMRYSLVSKEGHGQPKPLHHYQIAAVSLFLATKTEENVRRTRELIVACCRVAQKNASLVIDEQSKDYWRWRDTLLFNEDVLLEALCFDLTIESPHKLLFDMLKALGAENNKKLRNAAWAFVNDTCLTQMCLRFPSKTIAAAAVFCGAKFCGPECRFADDEKDRPWWVQQGVRLKEIWSAANYMADLYEDQPPKQSGERSIYVGLRTPFTSSSSSSFSAAAAAAAAVVNTANPGGDGSRGGTNDQGLHQPGSGSGVDADIFGYRGKNNNDDNDEMNYDDETRLRNTYSLSQTPASPAEWMLAGGGVGAAAAAASSTSMLVDRGVKRDRDGTPKPPTTASSSQASTSGAVEVSTAATATVITTAPEAQQQHSQQRDRQSQQQQHHYNDDDGEGAVRGHDPVDNDRTPTPARSAGGAASMTSAETRSDTKPRRDVDAKQRSADSSGAGVTDPNGKEGDGGGGGSSVSRGGAGRGRAHDDNEEAGSEEGEVEE